jgi:hypothetical protein
LLILKISYIFKSKEKYHYYQEAGGNMPVAKTQQVKKGNVASPKNHKWYKGVLVVLAGLALISIGLFYIIGGSMAGDKTGMERYLRDKYGQEFKVTDVKSNAVGIGVPGQLIGKAYPVNDSGLVFEVGKSRATGAYFDGYSGAVWAQEERPHVESFLKTIYGAQVPDFDLSTHIPTAEAPDPIRGKVPNFSDALRQYGDNFSYSIGIKTTTHSELSQSELVDNTAKLEKIVDFVLAKKVSSPTVRYAINIKNKNAGYLCNLDRDQLTDEAKITNCLNEIHRKAW